MDFMHGKPTTFTRRLLRWYHSHQRDLPWRAASHQAIDPYHVFVSEAMLQQTQVATVIPYFHRFIERFPTFQSLAESDEQDVLRLWQGLGYYSRARNLRKAAAIIGRDGLSGDLDALLQLPGVGRYTAGAVASIAFGKRCAILDGNVIRVLCRLDAVADDPKDPAVRQRLWRRAAEILPPRGNCGHFNSALMELGAIVCTPRSPKCPRCPVRPYCMAAKAGIQETLPLRTKRKPIPLLERFTFCIRDGDRWLIEQRPATGRWARMWQFITREADVSPIPISRGRSLGVVDHALTHRRYRFHVTLAESTRAGDQPPCGKWITIKEMDRLPMPRPHVLIAQRLE